MNSYYSLPVEMYISLVTVEICMELSEKNKNTTTHDPSLPLLFL
jgi:hypothetical protein